MSGSQCIPNFCGVRRPCAFHCQTKKPGAIIPKSCQCVWCCVILCAICLNKVSHTHGRIRGREMICVIVPIGAFSCHLHESGRIPTFSADERDADTELPCLKKNQGRLGIVCWKKNDVGMLPSNFGELGSEIRIAAAVGYRTNDFAPVLTEID